MTVRDRDRDPGLLELLEALCDERIGEADLARLQDLLRADPEARRTYLDYLDMHLALRKALGRGELDALGPFEGVVRPTPARIRRPTRFILPGFAAAAAALVAVAFTIRAPVGKAPGPEAPAPAIGTPELAQSSGAKFFGGRSLPIGARLGFGEEFALIDGSLELRFADGATAILAAPAVFEVADRARLIVKLGRCSVHAPDGAQGFRLETPVAEVVDLGTRFSVDVHESGGADVQVIEGLAEVSSAGGAAGPARLTGGQARRYAVDHEVTAEEIAFEPGRYRAHLPDRVVTYEATERDGGAGELLSVSVQRGGDVRTYRVDDLIGIDLIHFAGGPNSMTTALGRDDSGSGDADQPGRAALLDRDADLNTGIINPGGSPVPLDADPIMNEPDDPSRPNTPGLAVRFREPVVNAEGPDVVLFDLQIIVHPEKGDPFHVSPLRFRPGLRSHTIRAFDIDLGSPEARTLAGFRLYHFESSQQTLGELLRGRHNGGIDHPVRAKALAVGIDLSDLGYRPGEAVEGLFFQDVRDDGNTFDPVFLAGLPPLRPAIASAPAPLNGISPRPDSLGSPSANHDARTTISKTAAE